MSAVLVEVVNYESDVHANSEASVSTRNSFWRKNRCPGLIEFHSEFRERNARAAGTRRAICERTKRSLDALFQRSLRRFPQNLIPQLTSPRSIAGSEKYLRPIIKTLEQREIYRRVETFSPTDTKRNSFEAQIGRASCRERV